MTVSVCRFPVHFLRTRDDDRLSRTGFGDEKGRYVCPDHHLHDFRCRRLRYICYHAPNGVYLPIPWSNLFSDYSRHVYDSNDLLHLQSARRFLGNQRGELNIDFFLKPGNVVTHQKHEHPFYNMFVR